LIVTTYLEIDDPAALRPAPAVGGLQISRVADPSVNRDFYARGARAGRGRAACRGATSGRRCGRSGSRRGWRRSTVIPPATTSSICRPTGPSIPNYLARGMRAFRQE
jgi:hypothetical protein